MPDGTVYSAREMAREQGERLKTGGIVVFPNSRDQDGAYQWMWDEPKILGNATEIREYPRDLDLEIARGLGIPDSVINDPSGTGSYAGRRVPERAFYVSLEQIICDLMSAIRNQILDPLLKLNFAGNHDYEIITKPLVEVMSPEATPPAGYEQGQMPGNNSTTIGNIFSGAENPDMGMGLSNGAPVVGAPSPQGGGGALSLRKNMSENYIHSNKKPMLGIGLDKDKNIVASTKITLKNRQTYEKGSFISATDIDDELKIAGFQNGLEAVIKIARFSLLNRDTANTLFKCNSYQLSLIKDNEKLNKDITDATYESVKEAWDDIQKIAWLTPGLAYAIYKKYGED